MKFIPAIDLRGGRCVRLAQGDERREKVYSEDPISVARWFAEKGVDTVHVVDLDGAIKGVQENVEAVKGIMGEGLKVQLGGGIRSFDIGRMWLDLGLERIVVSTMFFSAPGEFLKLSKAYGNRVWVGLDVKGGRLALKGWKETVEMEPSDAAKRAEELGAGGIVYTDTLRDGMETGPDFDGALRVKDSVSIPVIISGGVRSLEDIKKAKELGFYGIISGRAVYEGRFNIEDAVRVAG